MHTNEAFPAKIQAKCFQKPGSDSKQPGKPLLSARPKIKRQQLASYCQEWEAGDHFYAQDILSNTTTGFSSSSNQTTSVQKPATKQLNMASKTGILIILIIPFSHIWIVCKEKKCKQYSSYSVFHSDIELAWEHNIIQFLWDSNKCFQEEWKLHKCTI